MMAARAKRAGAPAVCPKPPGREEVMVRFLIAPTTSGAWRWETFDRAGKRRTQGFVATRRIAAAVVIREILKARHGALLGPAQMIHRAKAA